MSGPLPIRFQELLQLTSVGISPDVISFSNLTLESAKYICIRETTQPDKNAVVIIDMAQPTQPVRRSITADSAIMCPDQNVLALKAGNQLQIFNMDSKARLKAHTMTEAVVFWKWINNTTIGMVTAGAVYHWTLDGPETPTKIFERHASLNDSQIINYRSDSKGKWLCLVGIAQSEGRIVGNMQLYSIERKVSQAIEGHACAFADFTPDGATGPSTLFTFAKRSPTESKLYIIEVGKADPNGPSYQKKAVDLFFPPDAAADFPVSMQVSQKYNVIYVVTKLGYLHIFDLDSATSIYRNRISSDTIFVTSNHDQSGGILGIDRKGRVLLVTLDEKNVVPYICNNLNNYELAIKLASKGDLPGAEDLFTNQFNRLFQQGNYAAAAKVAAESPQGILRTNKTLQLFQQLPTQPGQASPLLQYFGILMEKGRLNKLETLELTRPVLQQGRKQLLEKWLQEDKLTCSEELGDLVKPQDVKLALNVYYRAETHPKVIIGFAESGEYDKIVAYAQKVGYTPDWKVLLSQLLASNPEAAGQFAAKLVGANLIDVNVVVDTFMARGLVQPTTSLLLEVLKENKPQDAALQTKLLEINLIHAPAVADAILGNEMFSHYDRTRIAALCEKAALPQRALEHYKDVTDIKRVFSNTLNLNPEFVVNYFSRLPVDDSFEVLKHLLKINIRSNLQTVVAVCTKYSTQLGPARVVEMFESFKCYEGIFFFLGSLVNTSEDPLIHTKYIEAAIRTNQLNEVKRMVKESNHYDPEKTRDLLKEVKLQDQLPLIIVCDRFDFVADLTTYLYKNNMSAYIDAYVQKINPLNTPQVFGALIDAGCNEEYIRNLLMSVRGMCPAEKLVEVAEKRNKLKLVLPWLEARVAEGNTETELHNAIGKIYIDTGKEPEKFLTTNPYYDSLVIGKYCEKRDPNLAFTAYKRGGNNAELIEVTNKNSLFKQQARFLVERQDLPLYATVLREDNEYRRQVIDQIVQTALPEVKNPEEVSTAVKAFMSAGLPNELIELLDKVVLDSKNPEFSENKSLQNLLILTAIKADQSRVMNYINRLDKYDAPDIANVAVASGLAEEAFTIFKKFKLHVDAIEVLLDQIGDLERASEFADRINQPETYSKLGQAQLNQGQVSKAITSFIKANDPEFYNEVIAGANQSGNFEELVKYLEMCRKKIKEPKLESELVFAYARTSKNTELEEFVSAPGCLANILETGERCFDAGLYEAARILFANIDNYSRLASALVKLGEFSQAVDAARKANSLRTWKEVNLACVEAKQFRLAQTAGLYIIPNADELEEVLLVYETRAHFDELIALLETGIQQSEGTHVGMFTSLAIIYSRYKEEKLMEYLKAHYKQISLPRVISTTQQNFQWPELTFLQIHFDEFDNACITMLGHIEAWEHPLFKETIVKTTNHDICYRAIQVYLEEHPLLINDLLSVMTNLVDHSRVVGLIKKMNHLPLVKPYLQAVQDKDILAVNESLNEIYVDEEDYESLRSSIDRFTHFEAIDLAKKLESHQLLEFRRIAAYLYKQQQRWADSVELSKKDKLYKDAIETAAKSKKQDVAEDLLNFFISLKSKECFAATLYTCYDAIRPDIALELAWKNNYIDFAFPFLIQVVREYTSKVDGLVAEAEKKKKEAEKKSDQPSNFVHSEDMYANQIPQIAYYDPSMQQGYPPTGMMPPYGQY